MRTLMIAPGVTQIMLAPRQAINAYLVDSVLVDAGIRGSQRGLLAALADHPLTAHVLTHAQADHQGASAAICAARDVPLLCAEAERELAESGQVTHAYPNPAEPAVADFYVIETPGHAPGHLALWRERDGVLIAGDVLVNMHMLTTACGLHEPPDRFTVDPRLNRQSIKSSPLSSPR